MKGRDYNALWFFDARFVITAAVGTAITMLAIFLVTLPGIIKPLYQSEVIVYAPLAILSQQLNQQGIGFGDEKEIDWYIQTLKSTLLADSLNKKFDLFHKFSIDPQTPGAASKLYKKLGNRMHIEKTRYGSVSIKVLDSNPQLAADMANAIVSLGETIKKNMLFPNRFEAMSYAQNLYEQKASDILQLEKQMDSLRRFQSFVKSSDSPAYSKALKTYNLELPELVARKEMYERKKEELDTPLPGAYVISSAVPASDPVLPKRLLLIISGATVYLLLLAVIEIFKHDMRSDRKEII